LNTASLSLRVSVGDVFPYPGLEGHCKVFTILWRSRPLATIRMKVGCWSSSAIVNIMYENIEWRDAVLQLVLWKRRISLPRKSTSSVLAQNVWEMSDDMFSQVIKYL